MLPLDKQVKGPKKGTIHIDEFDLLSRDCGNGNPPRLQRLQPRSGEGDTVGAQQHDGGTPSMLLQSVPISADGFKPATERVTVMDIPVRESFSGLFCQVETTSPI